MSYKSINQHNNQQGISLVEIMIATVIGLVLTAAVIQLFASNKQTYRVTENASRVQESARFAMNFLISEIRMADFWGCRGYDVAIDNNLNPDPHFNSFATALEGTNDDAVSTNTITDGTDTITLRGAFSSGVFLTEIPASASADLKVTANNNLGKGDIVLLSDCDDGDIFQIKNALSGGGKVIKLETGVGSKGPGNLDASLKKQYGKDAKIHKINFVQFTIRNGANGQPALFRSINGEAPEELVEDIENMQILYGEDTDTDGAPNYYKPAGSFGLNMDNVVAVRISIVAVTPEDNVTEQANTYSVFGVVATPTDRRIRRVFTSTIVIRNRVS